MDGKIDEEDIFCWKSEKIVWNTTLYASVFTTLPKNLILLEDFDGSAGKNLSH